MFNPTVYWFRRVMGLILITILAMLIGVGVTHLLLFIFVVSGIRNHTIVYIVYTL